MLDIPKIVKLLQMAVENENWEIVEEVIQLLFDIDQYRDYEMDDNDFDEW